MKPVSSMASNGLPFRLSAMLLSGSTVMVWRRLCPVMSIGGGSGSLAERKYAWQIEKRSVNLSETEALAQRYRATFPYAMQLFSQTAQSVVKQVDLAYQAFFRRLKAGEKPGYPRFKGRNHFHSFEFKQFGVGARLDGRRLKLYGVGRVRVRWHRPIEGKIKTVRIVHKAGRWYACLACEVPDRPELPKTGSEIGIDLNLENLLTTSEGERVENPRFYREGQAKLRLVQRTLQRKRKGGKNRAKALLAVQRQHEHVKNQRTDFAHKLSHDLVQNNDFIALEALRITNMVRNRHLSKSILDAGWGIFKQLLTNKAVEAGRQVVFVDPAYTSMCCSNPDCNAVFEDLTLADRWLDCSCGLSLARDHNAAINILRRAKEDRWDASVSVPSSAWANVSPLSPPTEILPDGAR